MPGHIENGWEDIKRGELIEAERHFTAAQEEAPNAIDPWNGLGAIAFERADLATSLERYRKALALAKASYGGTLPARIPWEGEHKPALRALHGIGMNLYRMGKLREAKEAFEELLARNPSDEQGAHFLLDDLKKKKDLWNEV